MPIPELNENGLPPEGVYDCALDVNPHLSFDIKKRR
jgi:hypothetical protein